VRKQMTIDYCWRWIASLCLGLRRREGLSPFFLNKKGREEKVGDSCIREV
jgi:hypothetical protein